MQIKRIIRVPLIQLRIPFLPDIRVADDSIAEVGFAELDPTSTFISRCLYISIS